MFFVVHQVSSPMPPDVTVHTDMVIKTAPWNAVPLLHNDSRQNRGRNNLLSLTYWKCCCTMSWPFLQEKKKLFSIYCWIKMARSWMMHKLSDRRFSNIPHTKKGENSSSYIPWLNYILRRVIPFSFFPSFPSLPCPLLPLFK